MEISVGELFEEIRHDYSEKSVHLKFFICKPLSGEPQPLDCAAFRWVVKDDLASFEFPAADAQLLAKLLRLANWTGEVDTYPAAIKS